MSEKKRHMKISDGSKSYLIADIECGLGEIKMICENMAEDEEWTFGIVMLTEEECQALPEHAGW